MALIEVKLPDPFFPLLQLIEDIGNAARKLVQTIQQKSIEELNLAGSVEKLASFCENSQKNIRSRLSKVLSPWNYSQIAAFVIFQSELDGSTVIVQGIIKLASPKVINVAQVPAAIQLVNETLSKLRRAFLKLMDKFTAVGISSNSREDAEDLVAIEQQTSEIETAQGDIKNFLKAV